MVGLIGCIVALAVTVAAGLWVNGITHMKQNHPDYKGKDLFNEEQDDDKK